jgi:two-component system sensor histidine kinase RpfC
MAERNIAAVRDIAHAMRSSAANVGAVRVSRMCGDLYNMPAGEIERQGRAHVDLLNEEFARFRGVVASHLAGRREQNRPT